MSHSRHPGQEPKWHPLWPSPPSGTYYHCIVVVGQYKDANGQDRDIYCEESYQEPSPRCQQGYWCTNGSWSYPPDPGRCHVCGLIIPGQEQEADSDSRYY